MADNSPDPSTPPAPTETAQEQMAEAEWRRNRDDEFGWYESARGDLLKALAEAEKNYDTLLVTLSTLAIGSSFTFINGFIKEGSAVGKPLLVIAWILLTASLFIALADRLLTYSAHKRWRDEMDAAFRNWTPGARQRLDKKFDEVFKGTSATMLKTAKWSGAGTLFVGVVFLLCFVFDNMSNALPSNVATQPSTIINVNGGTATIQTGGTLPPTTQETSMATNNSGSNGQPNPQTGQPTMIEPIRDHRVDIPSRPAAPRPSGTTPSPNPPKGK